MRELAKSGEGRNSDELDQNETIDQDCNDKNLTD
jgi:hypothetical protein